MNKDLLKLFFIAVLFFPTLGKADSDVSKYINLLPKGKIREHCENRPQEADCQFLDRIIWSAVNEKNYASMTKAQQLAYDNITRFWLHERIDNKDSLSLHDWRKNNFMLIRIAVFEMALKMGLSAEQIHEEVTKIIEMCIKLDEDAEQEQKRNSPTDQ